MRIGTTRPYPPTGLTTAGWLDIPPTRVPFVALTTTQDGVYLHALLADPDPVSGDRYPHVVEHDGQLYLEDGHTRVARAILLRHSWALMRVFRSTPLEAS